MSIQVFFSYSHQDEELRDELAKHLSNLKNQGIITTWHDREIGAGIEQDREINTHLNSAQIILLLISADFMASDYRSGVELKRAMDRHTAGEARVIPVILRPVDWQGAPFSQLKALPRDARPITDWANRDKAFLDVAQGIRKAVEELKPAPDASLPPTALPERLRQALPSQRCLRRGLSVWLGVSALLSVVRFSGALQPPELWAFDHLMQMRLPEEQDKHLLIIEIATLLRVIASPERSRTARLRGSAWLK